MRNKKLLWVSIGFIAGMLLGFTVPRPYISAIDGQPPAFDHSDCQYPYRWSNPADGCDNSDPAVPECIKASDSQASEQACIDAFVKAHQEPTTTETPVEVVTPAKGVCDDNR